MTTLISATEYENFFALRCHPDAQQDFQDLADKMLFAYMKSAPDRMEVGQWHAPFFDLNMVSMEEQDMLVMATAASARTSYLNLDKEFSFEENLALRDKLSNAGHWSPFEHCAQAMSENTWWGNFQGWRQYRKTFGAQENRRIEDWEALRRERSLNAVKRAEMRKIQQADFHAS
jgi:thymidylate synthase ThyX